MPKFKYTPKKDNLAQNIVSNTQDEIAVNLVEDKNIEPNKSSVNTIKTDTISNIKPQPLPKTISPQEIPETKIELEEKDTGTIQVNESITVEEKLSHKKENENIKFDEINKKTKINLNNKISMPKNIFKNFKLNKKLLVTVFSCVLTIALVMGVASLFNNNKYTITTQDLIVTQSSTIKEGALIDIKNSIPLNLSIRDFNISISNKEEEITLSFWDFTDTNKNKVAIYVNDEMKYSNITFSKKPYKIKVPVDAKVTIMQTETTSSPYTPYAMFVDGITYFNRASSEKTNTYQFLVMSEKQDLTLEDFEPSVETEELLEEE